ncbi:MAG TPA: efflux RND transporter permease subunit, partial [Candidatus Hydrogenedentes bacterium]|nr:efflux RND transporter permease subunit [Candidatus Hydrogenedentota bacterium]
MSNPQDTSFNKGPIAWMAGHSVAANLLMAVCLVGGLLAMRQTKQEVFPDITIDAVTVSVAYPGASPEEIESGILLSIEEAIRTLDGVDEVISVAREGMGSVTIELLLGANVQRLAQDIKSEVDRIITFPEEAEEPEVRVVSLRRGVLTVVLYGDTEDTSLQQLGEQLRDWLLQSPDITQVDLTGLPKLEIAVEVPQDQLRRYGLTLSDVATRLRNTAVDIPGGGVKTETGEVLLRLKERREYGKEFADLPVISLPNGSEVRLRDIAAINDSFAETDRYSTFDGRKAVMLEVFRVGKQGPIEVAKAALEQIDEFQPYLPPGIQTSILYNRADHYEQRIKILLKNGMVGLVLVLIVLGIFLEARLAFWVMMGIPISFLGSFLFLPFGDVTINMMSLFAYIVAVGIVVDDAIVVGENVYHYHQEGLPFLQAAIRGAQEVAMPVTFSILTNIAAFIPIYFIPGTTGRIFQMIPIVVCIAFAISLVESLLILPAHLGHQRDRRRSDISAWLHNRQQHFSQAFRHWVRDRYGPMLSATLRHRYITVAVAVAMLATTMSYALSGRMGFQLFPIVESDYAEAMIVLPYGSPVSKTDAVVKHLEHCALDVLESTGHPELVKSILSEIGRAGSHDARVRVELAAPEIRSKIMGTQEFTERWRKAVGEVVGVEYLRFASDSGGPGSRGRPVTIELSHRDIDILEETSKDLAEIIATYPLVKDVDDGFQPGKQQLDFTLKPEGKSLGLTPREVARQMRSSLYGAEVLRQQRGRNEVKVMVRLPLDERSSEETIHDLLIRTPAGGYVPFREIAEIKRGRAYTTIDRRNGRRVIQVSADITPRSKAGEVLADLRENVLPDVLRAYPGLSYSFEGHQADIRESM